MISLSVLRSFLLRHHCRSGSHLHATYKESRRDISSSANPLRDKPESRVSRTISWLLRHGGTNEGIAMRSDGYVRVQDLLRHPALRGVDFIQLENLVKKDKKGRFSLDLGVGPGSDWFIRANQGHTLTDVTLGLKQIVSADEVPMAVHGTTAEAWRLIAAEGLSRMGRQHIHLASDLPRLRPINGISGLRPTSEILIFVNLPLALSSGLDFFLSSNGVVLTPGNESGVLQPIFFEKIAKVTSRRHWRIDTLPLDWRPPPSPYR